VEGADVGAVVVAGPVAPRQNRFARQEARGVIRDYNLWAKDVASGQETQLTKDG
jgi:hypothetical protein